MRHLPAWIPSHVDDSLMSTRSLPMPASSYSAMSLRALATISSLSKESLSNKRDVTLLPSFGDAVLDGLVHQVLVGRHLGGGEDERRVGGGVLRLVLLDGCSTGTGGGEGSKILMMTPLRNVTFDPMCGKKRGNLSVYTLLRGHARQQSIISISPVSATTTVCFFSWSSAVSIFLRLSGD
ncbi:hypothetical protein EYF80_030977 [Liparis tanakae]|uniref:Uncharacterized protein n=1 Tax=Liparis tanakae TaxID=230148 RepID=A0A4Z2GYZ1_9TELE|nr:hypothetical protein EYF80_030977 [Liparis tanakae]